MLRKHQAHFENILDEIISGEPVSEINIIATPGAGKSSIPIQATRLIDAGLADAVAWIVPRSALQNQGERGFMDTFFRELLGHNHLIRASTNDVNPCRGTSGFVTTYQAVSMDDDQTVLREIQSKSYILILDEPHHIELDGVWHEKLTEIYQAAAFRIKMTGTLGRGDKRPIAFFEYRSNLPILNTTGATRSIIYSRSDALAEKAILPIEFHLSDGEFSWKDRKNRIRSVSSFSGAKTPSQKSAALFTALNSDFSKEMIDECTGHWRVIKQKNPGAKMLVVCADYDAALAAQDYIVRAHRVHAEIATSHDSPEAVRNINRFKAGHIECLVTIAMAYEGLDVPAITHICCLTNIRTREWIEQMIARGVRIDKDAGPYESQMCHVFAPRDSAMMKVVKLVRLEQVSKIEVFEKIKAEKDEDEEQDDQVERDLFGNPITPISSKMTSRQSVVLSGNATSPGHKSITIQKTIKEQETELRTRIHKAVNQYCYDHRYKQAKINHELKLRFGKPRDEMTLRELEALEVFFIKHYRKGEPLEGVSGPRAKRKRISNKVKRWTSREDLMRLPMYQPFIDSGVIKTR